MIFTILHIQTSLVISWCAEEISQNCSNNLVRNKVNQTYLRRERMSIGHGQQIVKWTWTDGGDQHIVLLNLACAIMRGDEEERGNQEPSA